MKSNPLVNNSLNNFYAALAIVASLAATKAMVWPLWPKAQELNPQQIQQVLNKAGYNSRALGNLKASRNAELASSSVQKLSLANGLELRLMNATARERFNLQVAFFTRSQPGLKLLKPSYNTLMPPSITGMLENRPTRQACLVAGPGFAGDFGVTRDQLTSLTDQLSARESNRGWKVLLGLKSNRVYQCVLVSVSSPKGSPVIEPEPWQQLLQVLKPALQGPGVEG